MENPFDLSGQTILVTGASSGIGRATAVELSRLGARVVLTGRNVNGLEQTAAEMCGEGHRVSPFDLSKLEQIPGWFGELVQELGPFSGMVHSAGIAPMLPIRLLTLERLQEVMNVNFYAAALLTREFARKRAYQPPASIVYVASITGKLGNPTLSAYGASKGALIAFTKSAAIELAKSGIRVNCVAPSYVETDMFERTKSSLTPEQLATLVDSRQPLGLGNPVDVARSIAFLLADTGRWITGSALAVDGGYSAH
jgi:NAD(P)-dependent dehydrogenase (short-subunit alcohol dehydrogenase family)